MTRDGMAEPASRDQLLRHKRRKGNIHFPFSADHEQDWHPYPVDPHSAIKHGNSFERHPCHECEVADCPDGSRYEVPCTAITKKANHLEMTLRVIQVSPPLRL